MNQFKVRWASSTIHTGSDIDSNINRICHRSWHNHTRLVQRAITVCTHNPPLHLSHLQPFIRATRQESIRLSPPFLYTHSLCYGYTSTPPFQSHLFPLYLYPICFSLFSLSSFFFALHSSAPCCEPSRDRVIYFFPFLLFQQYLTAHCGSGRIKVSNPEDVP